MGVHLILVRDGSVLLGKRVNTGFADGAWPVPGGRLDHGETLPQAAAREAAEELGISVNSHGLRVACACHHLDPDGEARVGVFFHAMAWTGEPVNAEPGKCAELRWFALDALPDELVSYARAAIRRPDPETVVLEGWQTPAAPADSSTDQSRQGGNGHGPAPVTPADPSPGGTRYLHHRGVDVDEDP